MSKQLISRLVIIGVVIGTLIIIGAGLLQTKSPESSMASSFPALVGLNVGQEAPNFTLSMLNGQKKSLSDFRGKAVIINFWAINCEGCRAELPGMVKTYKAQAKNNLVILGVNTTDSVETARAFARQIGITYPILLDQNSQVDDLYNVSGTPTSFFIDLQGIIRSTALGPVDEQGLQERLQQISR